MSEQLKKWQARLMPKGRDSLLVWADTFDELLTQLQDPTRDKVTHILHGNRDYTLEIFYDELPQ